MSDFVRPLPASKRPRREGDAEMPLAILDSGDTQDLRQAMVQAEAIRDRDMPQTIEDFHRPRQLLDRPVFVGML